MVALKTNFAIVSLADVQLDYHAASGTSCAITNDDDWSEALRDHRARNAARALRINATGLRPKLVSQTAKPIWHAILRLQLVAVVIAILLAALSRASVCELAIDWILPASVVGRRPPMPPSAPPIPQ